jgi:hypothetical protein
MYIFKAKDDSAPNETKVVGNRLAQFRITTIAQQSFSVNMCDFKFKIMTLSIKLLFLILLNRFHTTSFLCVRPV